MFELFLGEFRRNWIQFRRYPVEAIAGIFVYASVFYGLFLSARYIAGSAFQLGDRLDSIIIGYVLWTLMTFTLHNLAGELQQEAQTGTLEQVFLSRYGAIKVFLMRTLANLTLQMIEILGILFIIMMLTGSRLNFPPTLLLPFVAVVLGANGFAFAMGSLALLFKRIQQLIALSQFPFLFLLTTPTETWTGPAKILAAILPMTPGAGLLRDLMARGESLNFPKLSIAFINGAVYFAVGLLLFHFAERQAKQRGMLSGY
ncbi:ABC transporter permease [Mastigocladopsis repens]|uniref:ABC transporter permease n=1 Tax=Mastigocladopsis repens TaxID=221287 RepID=UPI0002E8F88C|nr:ABC transporter permease [Mastigocladopsis repens]